MDMRFQIEWRERVGSTNTAMRERFLQHGAGPRGGLVIAAREQTAGRGRQGRAWVGAPGENLCFSLLVRSSANPAAVPSLTMAAALACGDLLAAKGIAAAPKWPNDVLVHGRKICGILSERIERPGSPPPGIVVGIGLNVNMTPEQAGTISRPATSMRIETDRLHDPAAVLDELCPHLTRWIGRWEHGGFSGLRETWTERAGPLGKPLTVHDGPVVKSGRLAGFGDRGELLLDTGGRVETIWSGEVSTAQG